MVAIGMIAMSSGCEKSETISPNPNQCYEGVVIAFDCPSLIMVQVESAEIGERWSINSPLLGVEGTFDNSITINNRPDELNLQKGDKVYFTIDIEASMTPSGCIKTAPCTTERENVFPTKQYCIKSISTLKCPENDEN